MDNGDVKSKIFLSPKSGRYSPRFFSLVYSLFLVFKTMTHFELILCVVSGLRPIIQAPLTKKKLFVLHWFAFTLSKINLRYLCGSVAGFSILFH